MDGSIDPSHFASQPFPTIHTVHTTCVYTCMYLTVLKWSDNFGFAVS